MTILHYTLGLYPQRSGGMTIYATDLMQEQAKENSVTLLYPSGYKWWSKRITWKRETESILKLGNTFPISILYGIKNPSDFMESCTMSSEQMESLYNEVKPDIFHIHTLMGLPKELILFFKGKGVKIVFTAHDYFAICPKVNMIDFNGNICNNTSLANCLECNRGVKSTLFLRLINSKIALLLKSSLFIRLLYAKK